MSPDSYALSLMLLRLVTDGIALVADPSADLLSLGFVVASDR